MSSVVHRPHAELGHRARSSTQTNPTPPARKFLGRLAIAVAALALAAAAVAEVAEAADSPTITRVEEDWEILVSEPNADEEGPQITTVISPDGGLDGYYSVFELNHATLPEYAAGGMQLQLWFGEWPLRYKTPAGRGLLNVVNERIRYTTRMSLSDGRIWFEVRNGSSTTWGEFGAEGTLRNSGYTDRNDLNSYSPSTSVKNSRVGFASNRVQKLSLLRVRYYSGSSLVSTDTVERVVSTPGSTVEN